MWIVTAAGYDNRGSATLGSMEGERGYAFTATVIDGLVRHWPATRVRDFADRLRACLAGRLDSILEIPNLQGMEMRRKALPRHNGHFCSKGLLCA